MRLNGWQRLWVVVAVLWTCSVLPSAYFVGWPGPQTVNEALAAGGVVIESPQPPPPPPSAEALDEARQAFRSRRVRFAGIVLMIWTIPPALLYAFGLSVGWVRRGFTG